MNFAEFNNSTVKAIIAQWVMILLNNNICEAHCLTLITFFSQIGNTQTDLFQKYKKIRKYHYALILIDFEFPRAINAILTTNLSDLK